MTIATRRFVRDIAIYGFWGCVLFALKWPFLILLNDQFPKRAEFFPVVVVGVLAFIVCWHTTGQILAAARVEDLVDIQTAITGATMEHADLDRVFKYHTPTNEQVERYARLRQKAKEFAALILACTPDSHEQQLALDDVQSAVMHANAAITIHES